MRSANTEAIATAEAKAKYADPEKNAENNKTDDFILFIIKIYLRKCEKQCLLPWLWLHPLIEHDCSLVDDDRDWECALIV